MLRGIALGDAAGIRQLVEGAFFEADRERAQRLRALVRGERRQERRVDAAGEQHADRDVADEMRAHGIAHPRAQLLDELGLLVVARVARRDRGGAREPLEAGAAAFPDEDVARRELADLAKDRQRRRNGVESEERLERVEVDLAARQRPEL